MVNRGGAIISTLKKGDLIYCTDGVLASCFLECACDSFFTRKGLEVVKPCEYDIIIYVADLLKVKRC